MKYLSIVLLFLTLSTYHQATSQIVIGKTSKSETAIIEFGDDIRGIILSPIANVTTTNSQPGTIAFDSQTGSFRYLDNSGSWSPARPDGITGGEQAGIDSTQFLIGTTTASSNAVLELGANSGENKAMVLPKIANGNLRFNKPVAGLIYYDTALKAVMVYNGASWTKF